MTPLRQNYLDLIAEERDRQAGLFGSEFDGFHGPNDWVAIITHYASEWVVTRGTPPSYVDFEDSLIKAGAVILAALEHLDRMAEKGKLSDEDAFEVSTADDPGA